MVIRVRHRMQMASVDFRRLWLDKDAKNPSREGIGIWRPVPPPGYCIVGEPCQTRFSDQP